MDWDCLFLFFSYNFIIFLIFFAISSLAFGQAANTREQEVLKAEQDRVAAVISGDTAKLEQILANDLTYTHSTALVESKTDFLNSIKSGNIKYQAMNHKEVKVSLYGDTAVLRGQSDVKVTLQGQQANLVLRFIAVYIKKDGRWQMTAWQSTRLPQQ